MLSAALDILMLGIKSFPSAMNVFVDPDAAILLLAGWHLGAARSC